MKTKLEARDKRRSSIRKRVEGTAERPRLAVFRSLKHIYAQVINDVESKTLAATSTLDKELKTSIGSGAKLKKKDQAARIGEAIAKRCLAAGIDKVVFDRGGYLYHGRVSALADGARKAGLKF